MTPDYYEGKETIDKQEAVAAALVAHGVPASRAFDAATDLKYIDRAGEKPRERAEDDLAKCAAYLYRAIEGTWPWERDAT